MTINKVNSKITFGLVLVILILPFTIKYGLNFRNRDFIDFPSFYFASQAAFIEGFSPYQYEKLTNQFQTKEHIFPFLYPPPALLIFGSLSLVDYGFAKSLLIFFSHLSFLLSLYLIVFRILKFSTDNVLGYLMLIYALSFQPIYLTLALGQVNIILLCLICFFWFFLNDKKPDYLTAIPLALAIILKTYPVIFLPYFLLKRKYALCAWSTAYLALAAALSIAVLPRGTWSDWITLVMPSGGIGEVPYNLFNPAAPWNQSINGFISRLFLPNEFNDVLIPSVLTVKILGYILVIIVLTLTFKAIMNTNDPYGEERLAEEICVLLLATYLIAPLSWEHHLVYLLPCIFILFKDLLLKKFTLISLILVGFSLILSRDIPLESELFKHNFWVLAISAKFYAVVIIWGYFIWKLQSSNRLAKAELS